MLGDACNREAPHLGALLPAWKGPCLVPAWKDAPQIGTALNTTGADTAAANTANHYFEIKSCCHSESGSKPQGWLARSSPAMQRSFHSIKKYHSASFPPLEEFFFQFSLFEYFSYFSCNFFTLLLPQLHGVFYLQCSHRYGQHIL